MHDNLPYLSVIVRTYNSAETLTACLAAIKNSSDQDYELLVIDDMSRDQTCQIAREYTNQVLCLPRHQGMAVARQAGMRAARGEVIACIDSDAVIEPETLRKISSFFKSHPEISALTGILSKQHPNRDFFSQYKNLYMHYIFRKLADEITFLYGSISVVRKNVINLYRPDFDSYGEDTYFGMGLTAQKKRIHFMRDLEVVHLKKYDFFRFVKNDFFIPFFWAKLFVRYKGWKQFGRKRSGFAHASKGQLSSVLLAPAIVVLTAMVFMRSLDPMVVGIPAIMWVFFNQRFINFLTKERGLGFGSLAVLITFFDNVVMFCGIVSGLLCAVFLGKNRQGGPGNLEA